MTTESNEPQRDTQQLRSTKRAWSAPRVIEAELGSTEVINPNSITPYDAVAGPFRFGPAS